MRGYRGFARVVALLALALSALAGCAAADVRPADPEEARLLRQASVELDCPERHLSVAPAGRNTKRVAGCGEGAVYQESCQIDISGGGVFRTHCFWMRNAM